MRRVLVLLMLCLLPFQMSRAAVAEYCSHEQDRTAQHIGHHDAEHKASSTQPDPDKQPEKFNFGHDHCHLSGFLGFLNEAALDAFVPPAQPTLRYDEAAYPSLAPDRPERPKWHALA